MRLKTVVPSILFLLAIAPPAWTQENDPEQYRTYEPRSVISAAEVAALREIQGHMSFLASDAMAGRDTATVEGALTARYVASQLLSFGFEPAGDDGSFLQSYPLVRSSLDMEGLVVDLMRGEEVLESFVPDEDYAVRGYGGSGYEADAELVFAGHGLVDEASAVDDFGGLDVEGKLVMVISGAPDLDAIDPALIVASNWRAKQRQAKARGAAGLVIINPPDDQRAEQWYRYAKASMRSESTSLGGSGDEAEGFPRLYLQPQAAQRLFEAAGYDLSEVLAERAAAAGLGGFPLEGVHLSVSAPVTATELTSDNTVGLLRGTAPELAEEMIVLSAHMDHVGVGADGAIYNGADDNASGTTTLLMVAQALARDPSRLGRSVVILGVSGEEKGLLGSEWWVANPTVDISKVVANINIDMVGRNEPDSIGVTPSPEHPEHNSLVTLADSLGPEAGIDVDWLAGEGKYRRAVDEYFYRSDHVNFSNAGIPVIFFFAGEHEDYHKPTDTLDKIDTLKMLKVANLVTLLTRAVSVHPERPVRFSKFPAAAGR